MNALRVRVYVNWGRLTAGLRPALEACRSRVVDALVDEINASAPDSIRGKVRRTRLADVVITSPSAFIEFGTGPGYFPNLDAIRAWARSRGKTERGVEYRIGRAIEARGTPPRPFVYPAVARVPVGALMSEGWARFFTVGFRRR